MFPWIELSSANFIRGKGVRCTFLQQEGKGNYYREISSTTSIILELQSSHLPQKNFNILREVVENLYYKCPMWKKGDG